MRARCSRTSVLCQCCISGDTYMIQDVRCSSRHIQIYNTISIYHTSHYVEIIQWGGGGGTIILTLTIGLFHSCTISTSLQIMLAFLCNHCGAPRINVLFLQLCLTSTHQVPIDTWVERNSLKFAYWGAKYM